MSTFNPGRWKLKPHILKMRGGLWITTYRDRDGITYPATMVTWMTSNSVKAREAKIWCAVRNARIVANLPAK